MSAGEKNRKWRSALRTSVTIFYTSARILHTSVTFRHTSVAFLHTSVTFLHTSVTFFHTSVTFLHTSVTFFHTSVTFLHTSVTFLQRTLLLFAHSSSRLRQDWEAFRESDGDTYCTVLWTYCFCEVLRPSTSHNEQLVELSALKLLPALNALYQLCDRKYRSILFGATQQQRNFFAVIAPGLG